MTTTRILPAVVLIALATSGAASGQFRMPAYAPPGRSAPAPTVVSTDAPALKPAETLDRLTAPVPPGAAVGEADPVGTLTSPSCLPPGSYASPWYKDGPGCASPIGAHGPVSYDVYWYTGPNFAFGSGPFTDRLHMGWALGGGARSLFFNPEGDAAWTFDLGLSYTYNRGSSSNFVDLFLREPDLQNPFTGEVEAQPDRFRTTRIRGLHRTSFNFGIGRDWFQWGNGLPGGEEGPNFRVGTDVGGRWGTAHVDLVPFGEVNGYSRRQSVFHGVYLGLHTHFERPMGGWILFGGTRVEWGYDWMNIVPPIKGDIQNVNLFFTSGVRY
jgi:hypothetical protein